MLCHSHAATLGLGRLGRTSTVRPHIHLGIPIGYALDRLLIRPVFISDRWESDQRSLTRVGSQQELVHSGIAKRVVLMH